MDVLTLICAQLILERSQVAFYSGFERDILLGEFIADLQKAIAAVDVASIESLLKQEMGIGIPQTVEEVQAFLINGF